MCKFRASHLLSLSLLLSRSLSLSRARARALSLSLSNQVMSALKAAQSNACLLANYSLETDALKAQIGQLTRDLREEQGEREKLRGLVNAGQSNWDQLRLEARGLQGKVHDLEAQNTVLKHQLDEATRRLQVMTLTADQEASRPALLFADQRCFSDSKEQRSMPSTCTGYLHRHPHAHAQGSLSSKGFY